MDIYKTETYDRWFHRLKDLQAKARITVALRRCELANQMIGDIKSVGDRVFEMRIHTGPGYRIYFTQKGQDIVLLLIGGDKSSQQQDIQKAINISKEYYGGRK